jgi:hypothetical protein
LFGLERSKNNFKTLAGASEPCVIRRGESMASDENNRKNNTSCNNSCGPKTQAGKRRVRLNALKDGLFAKELIVQEDEKPEYEVLRTELHKSMRLSTAMQQIGFERIVCCDWRSKLSLRREMRRLSPDVDLRTWQDQLGNQEKGLEVTAPRWYAFGRAELRAAARLLLDLRQEIKQSGGLQLEEWKERLSKNFGDDFYDTLTRWQPVNTEAIRMAEHLVGHSKLLNLPLPDLGQLESSDAVIGDPRSRWEMMVKIVDLQLQHVYDLRRRLDETGAGGDSTTAASGEDGRYFARANNDLERAVAWYQYLKEQGL